jgi:hypothetical protein
MDEECQSMVCSKDLSNGANLIASNNSMALSAEQYESYDLGICMEQKLNQSTTRMLVMSTLIFMLIALIIACFYFTCNTLTSQ